MLELEQARKAAEVGAKDDAIQRDVAADLHRMAAAAALATLAPCYRDKGFDGLEGASDWRSLRLHCVATLGYEVRSSGAASATQLLVRAVDLDPGNRLAAAALQNLRFRVGSEVENYRTYAGWLKARLGKVDAVTTDFQLRIGAGDHMANLLAYFRAHPGLTAPPDRAAGF